MVGQVIGNYRVVSELGRGGMGVVYAVEHVQLGRPAALKMLLPQFSSDDAIVKRFLNEARAASQIDHPGIVEIYEVGTHVDGRAYIVMALLKGESLQQRIAREPLAPTEGATIVAQVASALAAAHARGIVHRDLKPDNIFLVGNELVAGGVQAKLLDFGIAKLADERASFKTQTGSLIGTPAYMSPEQCMGRSDLDHRTDLYALGCILFHVLCGRPPFVSEAGAGPMIAAHLRDPAPDPRGFNPNVSPQLAAIVLQLLEKDPRARIQTANDLRTALMNAGANVSLTRPITAVARPSYHGPEAFHATTAPTTGSGSAAQLVQAPPAPSSRKGMWIGLGAAAIAAAAIATVVVMARKEPAEPTPQPTVQHEASPPPPPLIPLDAAVATAPIPMDAAAIAKAVDDCPMGQSRREDTNGQCCWPEQAWSMAKQRCVGTPRCPKGMTLARETCVAAAVTPPVEAKPTTAATFVLNAQHYQPEQPVVFTFPGPLPSYGNNRAWITITEESWPKEKYGEWTFVTHEARSAMLKAPKKPGRYEARLHTHYAEKSTNLRHSVRFEVTGAEVAEDVPTPLAKQRFRVKDTTVPMRGKAVVVFAAPLIARKGERFWITVVKPELSDDHWGDYEYVPHKAIGVELRMPGAPGEYEIRLHANYPTQTRNVVHRARVTVR